MATVKRYITANRIRKLRKEHRAVAVHPRKKTVTVDGFQYFKITVAELGKLKR